jgi:hypothetical protein
LLPGLKSPVVCIYSLFCQYITWSEVILGFLLSMHKPFLLEIQLKLVEATHKNKNKKNVFQTSLNMARSM